VALTKKMQLFVKEYCADPSCGKAQAARKAGYSSARAQIRACELMKNPEVQREIERQMMKRMERIEVTQDSVLRELSEIIEAAKAAGAGAWQMTARLKAVEMQGRFLKMFTDRVEVGPNDALMELLLEGRKRAGLVTVPELPEGGSGSVN
jgi:hypothetical protein